MPLKPIADIIQKGLDASSFAGSLKFDCGEDGVIVLDEKTAGLDDKDTDCTIKISTKNLQKLVAGKLNPMTGVMMGKLKVAGDVSVAMKLGKLLQA